MLVALWLDLPMFALSCPLSQGGEMGLSGINGLIISMCLRNISVRGTWRMKYLRPLMIQELSSWSICAKYPFENFLQTFETGINSLWKSLRGKNMQALASLAWQSNSLSGGNGWEKQPCTAHVQAQLYQAMSGHHGVILETDLDVSKLGWSWVSECPGAEAQGSKVGFVWLWMGYVWLWKRDKNTDTESKSGFTWNVWQCYHLCFWHVGLLLLTSPERV